MNASLHFIIQYIKSYNIASLFCVFKWDAHQYLRFRYLPLSSYAPFRGTRALQVENKGWYRKKGRFKARKKELLCCKVMLMLCRMRKERRLHHSSAAQQPVALCKEVVSDIIWVRGLQLASNSVTFSELSSWL